MKVDGLIVFEKKWNNQSDGQTDRRAVFEKRRTLNDLTPDILCASSLQIRIRNLKIDVSILFEKKWNRHSQPATEYTWYRCRASVGRCFKNNIIGTLITYDWMIARR